ncbi:uncharacterized protein BDZ99DRAFT_231428 [Mytilinidion resinicola]|uniref:Uncharacterized protein n=1 Tax=Mytilinidion resinicola TaxID=574789 RepID=A0A6A6Z038_9PEZI|nr:uncharacterized protein BDZ99DRAFT_231428 [Mytilinidion resinicola]KAF2814099.1 hypothetical protein BDZ99DRAFT_231428 [Mytilinidion resinicola]
MGGIECVPVERELDFSGKQVVAPTEKEPISSLESEKADRLPLPKFRWQRIPVRYRVLIIVAISTSVAIAVGLSLGFLLKKGHTARSHTLTLGVAGIVAAYMPSQLQLLQRGVGVRWPTVPTVPTAVSN